MRNTDKIELSLSASELINLCRFFRRGIADAKECNIATYGLGTLNKKLSEATKNMQYIKAKARIEKGGEA